MKLLSHPFASFRLSAHRLWRCHYPEWQHAFHVTLCSHRNCAGGKHSKPFTGELAPLMHKFHPIFTAAPQTLCITLPARLEDADKSLDQSLKLAQMRVAGNGHQKGSRPCQDSMKLNESCVLTCNRHGCRS